MDTGRLQVVLDVAQARVRQVTITSTRPAAARALVGKDIHAALPMVPLLFSLCGAAQAVCAVRAAESALGVTPDRWTQTLGSVVVLLESLQLHALAAGVDWRARCGLPEAVGTVRQLALRLQAVRQALGIPKPRFVVGAVIPRANAKEVAEKWRQARAAALEVFGPAPSEDVQRLDAWGATAAPVPEVFRWVQQRGLLEVGAAQGRFLPPLDPGVWSTMLDQDRALELTPTWNGSPAETGALARPHKDARVATMLARHGSGLGTRLLARVVDVHHMLDQVDGLLSSEDGPAPAKDGTACVETARGTLVHHVALQGTQVVDWRVVAPTEWNFHPQGPACQALLGAGAAGAPLLETAAQLLVGTLDPCVEYDLKVHHA